MRTRKYNYFSQCVAVIGALIITIAHADTNPNRQAAIKEAQKLTRRADALFQQGKYSAAIPFAEQALALQEKAFGPDRPETAASLNTLGMIVRYSGDYLRAKDLLERALVIRERTLGSMHADTATSLNNVGGAYHLLCEFDRAKILYERSLSIRKQLFGEDHPDTAVTIANLGLIYERLGDFEFAERYTKRALEIDKRVVGMNHRLTAKVLANLGNIYISSGDYRNAEHFLQLALTTRQAILSPDHPETAASIFTLGKLYYYSRFFSKAEPLLKRSLEIYENALGDSPDTADNLTVLATLYSRSNDADRAEPLFLRALSILDRILGIDSRQSTAVLNNLAEMYTGKELFAKAIPLYERAIAIKGKESGQWALKMAATLNDFAVLYAMTSDRDRAEAMFRSALQIRDAKLTPDHPDTATTLNHLGMLKWAQGNLAHAVPFLQRAQSIQTNNNSRLFALGSETRKKEYLQSLESTTFKHVSYSLANNNLNGVNLGLDSVLQFKGRVLDAMTESAFSLRQSIRVEDRILLHKRLQLANDLSALAYRTQDVPTTDEYLNRIRNLSAQQEALDAELSSRSSIYRRIITPVTIEVIRQSIPPGAALIEWLRYQPFDPKTDNPYRATNGKNARYVAYVVKRDAVPVAFDIGDAKEIELMVQDFRRLVSDPKSESVKTIAAAIHQKLVKPLLGQFSGTNHLLVSPDGALNIMPFGALINGRGKYLAEQYEISYLTSGRDLLRMDSKPASLTKSIVMADPVFGSAGHIAMNSDSILQSERSVDLDRGGLVFRPLLNTSLEAQNLGKLLKLDDSQVLLRDAATESKLKALHAPEILHIATHGFFLSDQDLPSGLPKSAALKDEISLNENPLLRSGIALSGANARRSGTSDDGILTALEAAQLDLQGTQLVVLSACDSGVGEVQNGEGVYGLRRALVLAGAETQVTSLWKVSDEATRKLMVDYYQRLLKGEGRSAALRSAQLDMLATPQFSHPYYWASFIPVGNWTPLSVKH